jgi:RimJ/RimL family protein N-acetyltransferase
MILKTGRLVLRPMAMEDAPALFAILGDPEAMRFWDRAALPRVTTVQAQIEDELAAMAAGGFFYWTVLKDDEAIGSIDLSHIDGMDAWTGFAFHRDHWGQGFAREALGAVAGHAFGPLRLIGLMARVQTGNRRAVRLLQSVGFQERGALPDIVRDGETRACMRYRLDKSISPNGK